METNWRSIESDPPKEGDSVWLGSSIVRHKHPIVWDCSAVLRATNLGYTHWSPCTPPTDLPPKPKTPFEEWISKNSAGSFVQCGEVSLPIRYADNCTAYVRQEAVEVIFNAGLAAGKAGK